MQQHILGLGTITFKRKIKMSKNIKKKLVFGLGSGRCGTASLAYLMSQQESTHASHELFPLLPWEIDVEILQFKWNLMNHQSHLFDVIFDAGIYYFPYVIPLINSWKTHQYAQDRFDLRFICLKRDRAEVVKSFLRKFELQNNNPLQNHGNPDLATEWDLCFPKYSGCSLEEAIGHFYDDYYRAVESIEKEYKDIFKLFDVEHLNSEEGVGKILNFVGYEDPKIITQIRKRQH